MAPRKKIVKEKRYIVHFYSYGHNYKSTSNCPKHYVDECRRMAKLIKGESVKVEVDYVLEHTYTLF